MNGTESNYATRLYGDMDRLLRELSGMIAPCKAIIQPAHQDHALKMQIVRQENGSWIPCDLPVLKTALDSIITSVLGDFEYTWEKEGHVYRFTSRKMTERMLQQVVNMLHVNFPEHVFLE